MFCELYEIGIDPKIKLRIVHIDVVMILLKIV